MRVYRIMGHSEWKLLRVSHHLDIFGVHWSSTSGDMTYLFLCHHRDKYVVPRHCGSVDMLLICHMILQDQVIKGSRFHMLA